MHLARAKHKILIMVDRRVLSYVTFCNILVKHNVIFSSIFPLVMLRARPSLNLTSIPLSFYSPISADYRLWKSLDSITQPLCECNCYSIVWAMQFTIYQVMHIHFIQRGVDVTDHFILVILKYILCNVESFVCCGLKCCNQPLGINKITLYCLMEYGI